MLATSLKRDGNIAARDGNRASMELCKWDFIKHGVPDDAEPAL
jgi:hypothetical protein